MTLRLGESHAILIETLENRTGWPAARVIRKLLDIGSTFARQGNMPATLVLNELQTAIAAHQIRREAEEKIAALKMQPKGASK